MKLKDCKKGQRVSFTVTGVIERLDTSYADKRSVRVLLDGATLANTIQDTVQVTNLLPITPEPAVGDILSRPGFFATYEIRAIVDGFWVVARTDFIKDGVAPKVYNPNVFDDYTRTPKQEAL